MAESWDFYKKLTGINPQQERFLLRHLWGIAVTGTVVLTWLAAFGFGFSPFVRAGDVQKVQEQLGDIKADAAQTKSLIMKQLKQSKATEIRAALAKLCTPQSSDERARLLMEKERLQDEYLDLAGSRYAEPPCEQLR